MRTRTRELVLVVVRALTSEPRSQVDEFKAGAAIAARAEADRSIRDRIDSRRRPIGRRYGVRQSQPIFARGRLDCVGRLKIESLEGLSARKPAGIEGLAGR